MLFKGWGFFFQDRSKNSIFAPAGVSQQLYGFQPSYFVETQFYSSTRRKKNPGSKRNTDIRPWVTKPAYFGKNGLKTAL